MRLLTVALLAASCSPLVAAGSASAQSAPATQAQKNAALIQPLTEIGRVRSRTPYCAALARARVGIDSAVAYQYQTPVVAADLRNFRLDSDLHRHRSAAKLQRDVVALWDFATAGRDDVLALKKAAYAEGVDEEKRAELLALANAVDGAKARQKALAKQIARTLGILSEAPIHTIANSAEDQIRSSNPFSGSAWSPGRQSPPASGEVTPSPSTYAQLHPDPPGNADRTAALFTTFDAEHWIRQDLEEASRHAQRVMALGNCEEP